jgi:hypothetical protein
VATSTRGSDERAFAKIKRVSSAGLEGPELLRRVAGVLGGAVPFDAYCASTTDPATNLMTQGIAEGFGQKNDRAGHVFLDRVYFEEDSTRRSRWCARIATCNCSPRPPAAGSSAACATASSSDTKALATSWAAPSYKEASGAGWT